MTGGLAQSVPARSLPAGGEAEGPSARRLNALDFAISTLIALVMATIFTR
ncbi:MAG TPA: hypothetical protein VF603_14150 [Allosphingosinicella sp.]|jgi:hypothetical protein